MYESKNWLFRYRCLICQDYLAWAFLGVQHHLTASFTWAFFGLLVNHFGFCRVFGAGVQVTIDHNQQVVGQVQHHILTSFTWDSLACLLTILNFAGCLGLVFKSQLTTTTSTVVGQVTVKLEIQLSQTTAIHPVREALQNPKAFGKGFKGAPLIRQYSVQRFREATYHK